MKVGVKRATLSRSRSWLRLTRRAVGLVLGVRGGSGRYQVFECKIKLLRISLLGFAAVGGVFVSDEQLFEPLDSLMLWDFTLLRSDQHRLQGSKIVWKTDRIQYAESLSNLTSFPRRNVPAQSS
jgi:hypothetical protein